jgi:hypothetical protein
MSRKLLFIASLLIILLSACGSSITNSRPPQTSAPLSLPPTWTPSPAATSIPTFTEIPTFTPVPVITLAYPTSDLQGALVERFQGMVASPNGQWVVYVEPSITRVVNAETTRVWTLPCELFDECSVLFPVKWSRNSQFLYFAPMPSSSGAPAGISLLTALAVINVRSGKWELVLPDSDRYYDFTFSPDDEYLAYTQSSGELPGAPSVTLGILKLKNKKGQQFKLDGVYGGNIVWSPYKLRFVFQTQDPGGGSSIVYFDIDTNTVKYVLTDEQSDLYMSLWDENNLVSLQKTDWTTHLKSDWELNPFTGEMLPASKPTPTP